MGLNCKTTFLLHQKSGWHAAPLHLLKLTPYLAADNGGMCPINVVHKPGQLLQYSEDMKQLRA